MSEHTITGMIDTLDALVRAGIVVAWVVIVVIAILATIAYAQEQINNHRDSHRNTGDK